MSMVRWGAGVLVVVCITSCSSKKSASNSTSGEEETAKKPEATVPAKPSDAAPQATAAESFPDTTAGAIARAFSEAKLTLGTHPLLEKRKDGSIIVKGWSKDGLYYFVSEADYADEIPGFEGHGVRLDQVRDVFTQRPVLSFQQEKWGGRDSWSGGDDMEKRMLKKWNEATVDADGYEAAKKKFGFVAARGSATSPDGHKLTATLASKAPYGSKFTLKDSPDGFTFLWTKFTGERTGNRESTPGPKIELAVKHEGTSAKVLTTRAQIGYENAADAGGGEPGTMEFEYNGPPAVIQGSISATWSPDGRRVFLRMDEALVGAGDEMDYDLSRSHLRSSGPQIKVVNAGIGDEVARKASMLLDSMGLTVTILEDAETPTPSKIYYRGEDGKAAAAKLATLFKMESEELKKDGWVSVIVMLGKAE